MNELKGEILICSHFFPLFDIYSLPSLSTSSSFSSSVSCPSSFCSPSSFALFLPSSRSFRVSPLLPSFCSFSPGQQGLFDLFPLSSFYYLTASLCVTACLICERTGETEKAEEREIRAGRKKQTQEKDKNEGKNKKKSRKIIC